MFRRTITFLALIGLGFSLAAVTATSATAKNRCAKLPVNIKLSTHDPTGLLEDGYAWVYVNPRGSIGNAQVKIKRGHKTFARGRVYGEMASGRTSVIRMHVLRRMKAGRYTVTVTARKAGCGGKVTKRRAWRFTSPSLGLKAIPVSTRVNDNVGTVRFVLRPIRRTQVGRVRVSLIGPGGGVISQQVVTDVDGKQIIAELPISGRLKPGKYRVRLAGEDQKTGQWRASAQTWKFARGGGGAKPVETTGTYVQKVAVDWYNGKWEGRQVGGFVAPGIGNGEIVCSPYQQWVRFYPSNGSRESAMMTWSYKSWDYGKGSEKAIREAKYATGTGPDFREGMNKWGPTEKQSTGTFQGIISDRGPLDGPGGSSLAPPTTFDLNWEWDFNSAGKAHCHVEATFRTQTTQDIDPLARSVQIVWRGESNATEANTQSTVAFPDLGNVQAICQAGPNGTRRLIVDGAVGGRVYTREGSDDYAVSQPQGPLVMRLPNNGMLFVQMDNGDRILVSSRWKVNDPVAANNWCVIAGQVYSPS
ncbi:MAG: hypothetical protein J0H98_05210 [Solirubrobacterales bacterium]|nr:hypothetical protein [Solirubrobacterales bacterium]